MVINWQVLTFWNLGFNWLETWWSNPAIFKQDPSSLAQPSSMFKGIVSRDHWGGLQMMLWNRWYITYNLIFPRQVYFFCYRRFRIEFLKMSSSAIQIFLGPVQIWGFKQSCLMGQQRGFLVMGKSTVRKKICIGTVIAGDCQCCRTACLIFGLEIVWEWQSCGL